MLQVEYAVRVPKAPLCHQWDPGAWRVRFRNAMVIDAVMPICRLCPDGLCVARARGNTWNFVSS